MQQVDVFWSFRSPYSYLAIPGLRKIHEETDALINIRPVYPLALRDDSFFTQARPQQLGYMITDMHREAERQNTPFRWPQPDPVQQDMATRKATPDQPHIHRLMFLGAIAQQAGPEKSFPFFEAVSHLIFSGKTDQWHEGDHLAKAAASTGFDLADMETRATQDHDALKALIEENEAEQMKLHWGVPLMVIDGEAFFGQDRLDAVRWRLENPK
jgi:2-hydroxychromene-2-carboxylate isomerase